MRPDAGCDTAIMSHDARCWPWHMPPPCYLLLAHTERAILCNASQERLDTSPVFSAGPLDRCRCVLHLWPHPTRERCVRAARERQRQRQRQRQREGEREENDRQSDAYRFACRQTSTICWNTTFPPESRQSCARDKTSATGSTRKYDRLYGTKKYDAGNAPRRLGRAWVKVQGLQSDCQEFDSWRIEEGEAGVEPLEPLLGIQVDGVVATRDDTPRLVGVGDAHEQCGLLIN